MTNEEIILKLEDHEHEIGSLKHRVKAVEEASLVLNRLATAVEVMAAKQDVMSDCMDRLTGKVDALEAKPSRRWDSLMDKLTCALAGAFLAWLISGTAGM